MSGGGSTNARGQHTFNGTGTTSSSASLRAMDSEAILRTPNVDEHTALLEGDYLERGQYDPGEPGVSTARPPPRWRSTMTKAKYYVPATTWLPNYSFSAFGGDALAGITIACILIPQSVSYATSLAKMSPLTGLFAAAVPGIVYAFLGTCRELNVGPEASLSLLMGQTIGKIVYGDPHSPPADPEAMALAVATAITFQVGLISFMLGLFRLGFMDVVLSRALLRGFVSALALIIMIEQLIPMFGLTALEEARNIHTTPEKLIFLLENFAEHEDRLTTIVSFTALGALILMRWTKNRFQRYWFIYRLPEVLIVVIAFTVLSREFHWNEDGIVILGAVPIKTGSSFFAFPLKAANLKFVRQTTSTAALMAVVGFLDSIVAAKQMGTRRGYSISPNRELVALGSGNLVASLIPGTLPAYGSITRSRINADVGATTPMTSLVCSGVILLATFFLLPLLYYLPKCVLASIICLVVFGLLAEAPHDIKYYWKMRAWVDAGLMALTFILTLIWGIEYGVLTSVIISLLLVVHRSSKTRMTILGHVRGTDRWKPINENPEAEEDVPGALIIRIRENLDFANTAQLKDRLRRLELYGEGKIHPSEAPRRPHASVLVFHLADMETCDASAVEIFYELLETYKTRGVVLFITHLRSGPRHAFEKGGIVKLLGEDAFLATVAEAMTTVGQL